MRFYVEWDVKPYELKSINQFDRPAEVSKHNCCVAGQTPAKNVRAYTHSQLLTATFPVDVRCPVAASVLRHSWCTWQDVLPDASSRAVNDWISYLHYPLTPKRRNVVPFVLILRNVVPFVLILWHGNSVDIQVSQVLKGHSSRNFAMHIAHLLQHIFQSDLRLARRTPGLLRVRFCMMMRDW